MTGAYQHRERPPLPCLPDAGKDDGIVSVGSVDAWRDYTSGLFRLEIFGGGHFFISDVAAAVFSPLA